MQWGRVKNVLIVILVAVNLFLLCNLGLKFWQEHQRERELEAHLNTLAAGYGITLDEGMRLPKDIVLPSLSLDRSRGSEEAVASAILGGNIERTEKEDGAVRFESESGTITWQADATLGGEYKMTQELPQNEKQALRCAQKLLEDWGLATEHSDYTAAGMTVTMSSDAADIPIFNRKIVLEFQTDGKVLISGLWSFGTPYTTAQEDGVSCIASDALLEFASKEVMCRHITAMSVGYRLFSDSSRRLQLTPTWKIETDSGEYLVDCAKNTILTQES